MYWPKKDMKYCVAFKTKNLAEGEQNIQITLKDKARGERARDKL